MIELGQGQATPASGDTSPIKDVDEQSFMAEVIEASQTVPVIVDLWAPWCGPCRQLTPALEAAVTEAGGPVRLAKVNVDENPMLAQQLRAQSIPLVYAFWQGQPVDGFQGAIPPSQIKEFVQKLAALGGGGAEDDGLDAALDAAEQMLEDGAVTDAAETFAAVLGEDDSRVRAYAGLARANLALGQLDQAEAVLNGVPADQADAPEIEAARAALALARQAADAGPLAELRAAVDADPDNHQARLDLATALHASGETEEAVNELLELFRRDREWNAGAAKAQLMTIFDALPAKDPVVLSGRRRLSSMIFA